MRGSIEEGLLSAVVTGIAGLAIGGAASDWPRLCGRLARRARKRSHERTPTDVILRTELPPWQMAYRAGHRSLTWFNPSMSQMLDVAFSVA